MNQLGFIDKYYLIDGKAVAIKGNETTDFELSVYEVFKVVSGIPLFFEDHIERLLNSLKISNIDHSGVDESNLFKHVLECCRVNNKFFGNIELRVAKTKQGNCTCLIGFIAHNYPNPTVYLEGVETAIMGAERINPNAKVKHTETRKRANKFINEHNIFEVLLKNQDGEITEGSRSNVFFINGTEVYTAPLNMVLPGISRKYVLKVLDTLNIKVIEKAINSNMLSQIDGAFLCGTSIGVLPIKKIETNAFNVQNALLKKIMLAFNDMVSFYLSNKSKKA